MREYLILTATFTAPFILLALLNAIPDLSRLCSAFRVLRNNPYSSVHIRKSSRFNPITTERR